MRPPSNKTLIFTGGINESLSNLEMKPGECYDLTNYEEISGEFHGYRSTPGWEVIDGTTVIIDNPIAPGNNIDVTYASTVPIVFTDPDDTTIVDDTARELRRSQIQAPPLTGGGYLKGAFDFYGEYFVIAYENSNGGHLLFRMTEAGGAGWEQILTFPTITEGSGVDAGIDYHITIGRFELYPIAPLATPNTDIAVLCNGIYQAIVLYKDNSGDYICIELDESNSPDYDGLYTPRLPSDPSIQEAYPIRSVVYNQRLHLAFPYGTLFVSHVGDPFFYDNALKSAGVWWLGSDITDFEVGPSSLQVFMEKGIDIIRPADPDIVTGFDEIKETFSPTSGAISNTVQRILGRTLFCDDRGITSLEATDTYGDFDILNLSKKVQKTYIRYKDIIVGTAIDRRHNQYIVYFSNGLGIVLTVELDYRGNFSVRGASTFNLGLNINTIWGVRKESKRLITNGSDGFLRLQHEDAHSFNGNDIVSRFTTSFHPYGSPVSFKTFIRILFELQATKGQVFSTRAIFDYQGTDIPKGEVYDSDPAVDNSIWGTSVWGTFIWGGTGAVLQNYVYLNGIGVNMAIQFSCTTRYHAPHVVHNAIVTYSTGNMRF